MLKSHRLLVTRARAFAQMIRLYVVQLSGLITWNHWRYVSKDRESLRYTITSLIDCLHRIDCNVPQHLGWIQWLPLSRRTVIDRLGIREYPIRYFPWQLGTAGERILKGSFFFSRQKDSRYLQKCNFNFITKRGSSRPIFLRFFREILLYK